MIDGHIHIEYGPYTLPWIQEFVSGFGGICGEKERVKIRILTDYLSVFTLPDRM